MTKTRTRLVLLLTVAALVHAAVYFLVEQHPESRILFDSREYMIAGTNLFSHGVLYAGPLRGEIDPALFTKRPFFYPLLIGLILHLGAGIGTIVVSQVLLSLVSAIILYWVAGLLGLENKYRLLLSAFFLFYPAQLIYSQLVMAEILVQFLLLLTFSLLVAGIKKGSLSLIGLSNLTLCLAALTKPVMVYFWIPNLAFHLWLGIRLRSVRVVAWAFLPLLIISGWCYRNYLVTGYFHFSSIKTINMQFNLDGSIDPPRIQPDESLRLSDFGAWSGEVEQTFIENRLSNWPSTAYSYLMGGLAFMLDPGRFDVYQLMGIPHSTRFPELLRPRSRPVAAILAEVPSGILIYLFGVLVLNLLILTSFLYVMFQERIRLEHKVYWGLLVFYVLVLTGPIGASRFRLEVEPFLLLAVPFFFRGMMKHAISTFPGLGLDG